MAKRQQVATADRERNCRFRHNSTGDWNYGHFMSRKEDDSIELICEYTGGWRTLFSKNVEFRSKGPRGGYIWVSAETIDAPLTTEE